MEKEFLSLVKIKIKISFRFCLILGQGRKPKKLMKKACNCPQCEERRNQEEAQEETSFAILLSCIPLVVFTFFGQMGLF